MNGDNAEPVFEWLKAAAPGLFGMKRVKWNFEKFLVGKDGVSFSPWDISLALRMILTFRVKQSVKGRWASTAKPETLEKPIMEALKEGAPKSEL